MFSSFFSAERCKLQLWPPSSMITLSLFWQISWKTQLTRCLAFFVLPLGIFHFSNTCPCWDAWDHPNLQATYCPKNFLQSEHWNAMTVVPGQESGDSFPCLYGWISPMLTKRHSMRNTKMIPTASTVIYKRQTEIFPASSQYRCCCNPVLPLRSSILFPTLLAVWDPKGRKRPLVIHSASHLEQFPSLALPRGTVPTAHQGSEQTCSRLCSLPQN